MDGPNTWKVGEAVTFSLQVTNPITGLGQPGQVNFITFSVNRASDGKYWTGLAWATGFAAVVMVEVDATNRPGLYRYVLSAPANNQADTYTSFATVNNPGIPEIAGQDSETHVSRVTDVRVYESEPA